MFLGRLYRLNRWDGEATEQPDDDGETVNRTPLTQYTFVRMD